jgi:hypothetical protein
MPVTEQLATNWKMFFEDKVALKEKFTDYHTSYLLQIFNYLRNREEVDGKTYLSPAAYRLALTGLGESPPSNWNNGNQTTHIDDSFPTLARELYRALEAQYATEDGDMSTELQAPLLYVVRVLSFSGHSVEARTELWKYRNSTRFANQHEEQLPLWRLVLNGLAKEKNLEELKATEDMLKNMHGPVFWEVKDNILQKYAELDAMEDAKNLHKEIAKISHPTIASEKAVLQACARTGDLEWGHSIVRDITQSGSINHIGYFSAVLMWAVETGKSIDEVGRMMRVMRQRKPDFQPDTTLIEMLLDSAKARSQLYLTERILTLAEHWDIPLNNWALRYIVDARLAASDIEGALVIYQQFEEGDKAAPFIRNQRLNNLINAMYKSGQYNVEKIMALVEELSLRRGEFDLDTITTLSLIHVSRNEWHELADLLETFAPLLFIEDRKRLRDVFFNCCIDRRNTVSKVWDIYMIFHQLFEPETDRTVRTAVMNELIARRRADMAIHVFTAMQNHWRSDTVTTLDTYVDMFVGLGRCPDEEALKNLHNSLKLDMNIEPNTKLYNALMLAYLPTEEPRQALSFWREIIAGYEGPDYNSVLIILRVCEKIPFGEELARNVWHQMQDSNVEITPQVFTAYITALTANDCIEQAQQLIVELGKEFGASALGIEAEVNL